MIDQIYALEARLARIARVVALVGLAGLLIIAVVTVADILGRWLFNAPVTGTMDLTQVSIVVVISACFPAGVLHRQHIAIRFVGERIGPRTVTWLDFFGALVLLGVLAGIGWQFVVYTGEIIDQNQRTWIIKISYAPWWILGTTLFVVTVPLQALVALVQFVRASSRSRTPVESR